LFQGEHAKQLDDKGRVSVPSAFRRVLMERYGDARIVVARWPYDPCLSAWPLAGWRAFQERLDAQPSSKHKRAFQRFVYSSAVELVPDRQGRVLLPAPLREYAKLSKEVQFVGAGKTFQIWDAQRWSEQLEEDLALAQAFEFEDA